MISISDIRKFFKGRISLNEPLSRFTTFRIGGSADYYAEPADEYDVLNMVRYLNSQNIPFYVMGNGSNVLISDEGIRGVVMNLESSFSYLKTRGEKIVSGAGVKMAKFADYVINKGFAGAEMLAGIPATLGGALVMNTGAYGGETSDYVTEVKVVKDGELQVLLKKDCGFSYRSSALRGTVVLEGVFIFPRGESSELQQRRKELLIRRNEVQPVEIPNAGCIFKNPEGDFAARLIEECGLKGYGVGGAKVSEKHANFIVNYNNASAEDVLKLIRKVRNEVKKKTGKELELEVKLIGFEKEVVL
ncbi:MAG: UDP-N-acetylmuramate dehydrogenase [Ignavibacteria bacterium]|nr:UDP-N-acetylmuramate dehydrogenase [Ignavibacteria bacterium]